MGLEAWISRQLMLSLSSLMICRVSAVEGMGAFDIFVGVTVGETERDRDRESSKWMFVRERNMLLRGCC